MFQGAWYSAYMIKKAKKATKATKKTKRTVRKRQSAKVAVATRKKEDKGVPVGFSIFKSDIIANASDSV